MSAPVINAPPFTAESAHKKVKAAQDLWNTKNPQKVAAAYTPNSTWRNRDHFFSGTSAIEAFLTKKWEKEHNYKLRKELFTFGGNKMLVFVVGIKQVYRRRILVRTFLSPLPQDATSQGSTYQWYRTYGLEHWVFNSEGKMESRQMSGNTVEIEEEERWFVDGRDVNEGDVPAGHISIK